MTVKQRIKRLRLFLDRELEQRQLSGLKGYVKAAETAAVDLEEIYELLKRRESGPEATPVKKHKHAFVGTDTEGTPCIYVFYIEKDGATGAYLRAELLQKIADRINNMRIGLNA